MAQNTQCTAMTASLNVVYIYITLQSPTLLHKSILILISQTFTTIATVLLIQCHQNQTIRKHCIDVWILNRKQVAIKTMHINLKFYLLYYILLGIKWTCPVKTIPISSEKKTKWWKSRYIQLQNRSGKTWENVACSCNW